MSQFFDDLEAQLRAAAHTQTGAPNGAKPPRARRRSSRKGTRAIPVAVAVAVTVAVVVIALTVHSTPHAPAQASGSHSSSATSAASGSHPANGADAGTAGHTSVTLPLVGTPLGHLTPQQQHELQYVFAAQAKAVKSSVCGAPPQPRTSVNQGTPPSALLSVLGVLQRPATPADRLNVPHTSRPLLPTQATDVYVRYVRRAWVKDGVSYYVTPVGRILTTPAFSAQCAARQKIVLRNDLSTIPAADRASTVALQSKLLRIFLRNGQAPSGAGVCITDLRASFSGSGACETVNQIAKGTPTYSDGSTLIGVVPDGVATVTLHYPADRGLASLTVSTGVAGNVYAVSIPRVTMQNGGGFPPDITWRAANGQIIKTFSTS
jgi:hypothetical protein